MPRPSNKVYVIGKDVFVPHPLLTGLWIRTDLSVAKVACPYPGCGSAVGVPCRSTSARYEKADPPHYGGSTHCYRRDAARGKGRDWKNLQLIIVRSTVTRDVTPGDVREVMEQRGIQTDGVDFEKLAAAQNDRGRAVIGWEAPRVLPASWREVTHERDDQGGAKYINANARLVAILTCSFELDGRAWLHLSVSHALRIPTWGEMRVCKEQFLGDREAYSIMPPRARYVNLHNNVLHLFALLDEQQTALPDFTGGTGSL